MKTEKLFNAVSTPPYIEANAHRVTQNKQRYKQRQALVEHPYGTLKRQWGFDYIITKRKIAVASADAGLMTLAYNLKRLFNLGVKFDITAVCAALNSFLGVMLLAITQLSTQQALKIEFPRNFIKFMKYGNLNPATEFKRKLV